MAQLQNTNVSGSLTLTGSIIGVDGSFTGNVIGTRINGKINAGSIDEGTLAAARVGDLSGTYIPQGALPTGSIPDLEGTYIVQGALPIGSIPDLESAYIVQGVIPAGSLTNSLPQGVLPAGSLTNALPQGVIPAGSLTNSIPQGVIPAGSLTNALPQGALPVGSIPDNFLKNDASDATTGDLTAANFNTTGSLTVANILSSGDGSFVNLEASGSIVGAGAATIVAEDVLTSTAQTITITGLDINTDGHYMLIGTFENNDTAVRTVNIYFENDTTSTNYYRIYCQTGTSTSGGRVNDAIGMYIADNTSCEFVGHIFRDYDGYCTCKILGNVNRGSSIIQDNSMVVTAGTKTNITRIDLVASSANALAVGTRYKLIKFT